MKIRSEWTGDDPILIVYHDLESWRQNAKEAYIHEIYRRKRSYQKKV